MAARSMATSGKPILAMDVAILTRLILPSCLSLGMILENDQTTSTKGKHQTLSEDSPLR